MSDTEPTPADGPTKCGFIALLGAPNAGKSTLINRLVGSKVAIVSPKVQTTRTRVLGITLEGRSQLVLVDTPGIFQPKRRLDRAMVASAWQGAEDADMAVLLVDSQARKISEEVRTIAARLKDSRRRVFLALNKIDAVQREVLLGMAQALNELAPYEKTFMISALKGDGIDRLRVDLAAALPEGPWLYPEDELTDMPMRLMAAEVTREKLFLNLHQELPYATTVETESWDERDDGSVEIGQIIYVQRANQKGIVLGHAGRMIRTIGTQSRLELTELFERRVHLRLFVKVRERWMDDPDRYRDWGLDPNS